MSTPPLPPDAVPADAVPADIAARVERAERRRARAVKLLMLSGALLMAAGVTFYAVTPHGDGPASPLVLGLIGAGLIVAFPCAALAAYWLGPTWTQRQQHYRLLRWQRAHGR